MCFDEQELCASQVWSQVPDWFREGVTSCLAKDASYTVRAQLGTFSNPFTVSGLAGSQATTTGVVNGSEASPGASISGPASSTAVVENSDTIKLSSGGIAGVVVASVAGLVLLAAGSNLLYRRRKARFKRLDDKVDEAHELHAQPALFESDTHAVHEKHGTDVSELPQQEPIELFAGHGVAEIGTAEGTSDKK